MESLSLVVVKTLLVHVMTVSALLVRNRSQGNRWPQWSEEPLLLPSGVKARFEVEWSFTTKSPPGSATTILAQLMLTVRTGRLNSLKLQKKTIGDTLGWVTHDIYYYFLIKAIHCFWRNETFFQTKWAPTVWWLFTTIILHSLLFNF